ncbi:MAG: RnfABCDGE type electron transport complex subunit C [Bacilli bacterium]|nr:RnfABCDGE type electron transport complex subunit C [Bacilli bacterium]
MIFKKNISSLHLPHNKHTAGCKPEPIAAPKEVLLPMDMHSGGLAVPVVNVGEYVRVGQLIAKEDGRFSSPVHATVSGTVAEIMTISRPGGKEVQAIRIENDGKMEIDPSVKAPVINNCDEFLQAIRESGVVGLGGAAFPTWAKLNEMRNEEYTVDTVLVNAAECEPYITSDHRMMVDHPELIVKGVEYMRQYMNEYLKDARFVICIEKNKPDAIAKMKEVFAGKDYVEIQELKAIYPQGAKQVMLYNATGRVSIAGKRFPYFHAIIINVSSLAKVAEYLSTGMPLVERIVTVDGPAVKEPKNLIAPIGTRISELLKVTGLKSEAGKVVVGGPMNGNAVCSVDDPIVKVSNCVLVFDEKSSVLPEPSSCIHCGRCINKCPIKINVPAVEDALRVKDEAKREKLLIETGVRQCVDCGCCSYVCPAHRHLLATNQEAKWWLKDYARKGGNK